MKIARLVPVAALLALPLVIGPASAAPAATDCFVIGGTFWTVRVPCP